MKAIFYLAGVLLIGIGVLLIASLIMDPVESSAILLLILLGIRVLADCIVGGMLLRRTESALVAGMVLSIVGLLFTLTLMASSPYLTILLVLDGAAFVCCALLYFQGRTTIKRLR